MSQLHDLVRLAFAAVIDKLHFPGGLIAYCRKRVPEMDGIIFMGGVLDHIGDLAIFHQPANFCAQMELFAVRANRPTTFTIQDDASFGQAEHGGFGDVEDFLALLERVAGAECDLQDVVDELRFAELRESEAVSGEFRFGADCEGATEGDLARWR